MIKFIYNWLQKFWNRVIITIGLIFLIVLTTYIFGSSGFSVEEFKPPLTVEKLCKVIVDDNYSISIQAPINTIDWLNELLKVSNFYDILHVKKLNVNFSKSITDLVYETNNYRNKNFYDLNKNKQNTIKRLNRLLLEETYPQETLKVNDLKNIAFVKAWICVGNLVTLFISGFIVCYTINEVFRKTVKSMSNVIEYLILLALIALVALAFWGMSLVTQKYLRALECSPIILVYGMFRFDKYLVEKNKSYFPRLYESRDFVRNFDIGILIGLGVTFGISFIMKMMVGNSFAHGFSSGATAFQLIIANLIFDPSIYEFRLQDGGVNNNQNG